MLQTPFQLEISSSSLQFALMNTWILNKSRPVPLIRYNLNLLATNVSATYVSATYVFLFLVMMEMSTSK